MARATDGAFAASPDQLGVQLRRGQVGRGSLVGAVVALAARRKRLRRGNPEGLAGRVVEVGHLLDPLSQAPEQSGLRGGLEEPLADAAAGEQPGG